VILSKIRKSLEGHQADDRVEPKLYRGYVESFGKADNGAPGARFVDTTGTASSPPAFMLYFNLPYPPRSPALEVGKPIITFCYQKDDVCYVGEEALGIIEDSDETFHAIRNMIESAR
jgi:hypothetical protein